MPEFILLLTGGDFSALSPAEMQSAYEKYMGWTMKLREEGSYIAADELEMTGKIIQPGQTMIVSDGPFAESKEAVGGFYKIKAGGLDEAVEIAKGCPHLIYGGSVEVRPTIDHSGG